MAATKPFSQACENNKQPILDKLATLFTEPGTILEIGTGTGQHAVHFAAALPHITWQPSDRPEVVDLCQPWLEDAGLANIRPPVPLDVGAPEWPVEGIDGAFSANTAHIMGWPEVVAMFTGVAKRLAPGGLFCLYGPFNYHGQYTSASNRQFDRYLKAEAGHMGIRDIDQLTDLARDTGLVLDADHAMPANNRLLVWRKL